MKKIFAAFFILIISASVVAKDYQLSARTVTEFKKFTEIKNDMDTSMNLATILITAAPFRTLLDKPSPTTIIEITQGEWDYVSSSLSGLSIHYKNQLKSFAQYEALKQSDSPADYRFWRNLANSI